MASWVCQCISFLLLLCCFKTLLVEKVCAFLFCHHVFINFLHSQSCHQISHVTSSTGDKISLKIEFFSKWAEKISICKALSKMETWCNCFIVIYGSYHIMFWKLAKFHDHPRFSCNPGGKPAFSVNFQLWVSSTLVKNKVVCN